MSAPISLEKWLAILYMADHKNQLETQMHAFRAAIAADVSTLGAAAQKKLTDLNNLIESRGERACAYSTKYRNYLRDALK